jgi:hypothetical protein
LLNCVSSKPGAGHFAKFLVGAFFVSAGILFYLYLYLYLYSPMFRCLCWGKFCHNTSDQRWPLHLPFHPLPALFLFGFRKLKA